VKTAETSEATSPMIELDAQEFGLHLKQGGWRLGLLVARDVEPGEGHGIKRTDRSDSGKVSAQWFAERASKAAGTDERIWHPKVMRYYRAWERYAAKGKVPHASELSPGDEPELDWDHLPHWTLSDIASHAASGPLTAVVYLGQYGDRQLRAHKRLIHFVEKDLAKARIGKNARQLAGRYAGSLEEQARVLRALEAGEPLPEIDELKDALEPSKFFVTAR
jgi:hypothetical protein